ncbi:hypothetical protein MMC25_007599 [Agyrium rufum]|nr:hypothetical protein [Agyrium rufum]
MSAYSTISSSLPAHSTGQHSSQVSTTTLLNTLHTIYTSSQTLSLDASTSLVVNTWLSALSPSVGGAGGGTVDRELGRRVWEHARRRAEDGCVVLGSLHTSTPSLLAPFAASLPLTIPATFYTALNAITPFLCVVTPLNASTARHAALAATFTMTLAGELNAARISLTSAGLDTSKGLLHVPSEEGYRAFDVFYYLLTSASTPAEREFLGLEAPSRYTLLSRSGTYNPPSYLPTGDDTASAEEFRSSLKAIGIKGSTQRSLLSLLAGLLKLGETTGFLIDLDMLEEICEDAGGLLGLDPEVLARRCSTNERETLIATLYECIVDWVLMKANEAIAREIRTSRVDDNSSDTSSSLLRVGTPPTEEESSDNVSITVLEVPSQELGKAIALRSVFDDTLGINSEMKDDGVEVIGAGSSVIKEMENAVADAAAELGILGPSLRERSSIKDRNLGVLEKVGVEAENGSLLRQIIYPVDGEGPKVGSLGRLDLPTVLGSSRLWFHLSLHPTDDSPSKLASLPSTTSAWSAGTVSRQLRTWRLPEWANRRNKNLDFTADFEIDEFCMRYARLGCKEGRDGAESWILERGWSNGEVVIGRDRVWVREGVWWEAESMLDMKPEHIEPPYADPFAGGPSGYSDVPHGAMGGYFPTMADDEIQPARSHENLLDHYQGSLFHGGAPGARSIAPTVTKTLNTMAGDYGLGAKGDERKGGISYYDRDLGALDGQIDPEFGEAKHIESHTMSFGRRLWVMLVWTLTFWIPSPALRYVGRMKRPDVRMAWREKLVLMFFIFLLNATIIFYIVEFGNLLCPDLNIVWDNQDVSYHQGDNDFYVSIHGKVYDISKFWTQTHGDTAIKANRQNMQQFAGMNLDSYFPPPLNIACRGLTTNDFIQLMPNDSIAYTPAIHYSGPRYQPDQNSLEHSINWYPDVFLPKIQEYYKGSLVWDKGNVSAQGAQGRQWFILNGKIYDLTDYVNTLDIYQNSAIYEFFPKEVIDLVSDNAGQDLTDKWQYNSDNFTRSLACMDNVFYKGIVDFRKTAKCTVNNYILLAFTIVLCSVILIKFLSALQFGSKRRPAAQDKFVICQVPAYTEGEDQLRKGLDSLTALQYDNKRKLIFVICDGMIVGGGNDRPTPKIVLDILGVDPKMDPPALPFRSVGQGSDQLNYGKVYSGLYEYEGNVVPYVVVVKVGKESEQTKTKPGNRGKRDSQILLLSFLNRVHHRAPMSPLELEIFHQINNIIGVDPELYEYLMMVDADTSVREDSLNRLVASCANDAKIAGICGETSLENEDQSWWTMIQVYEYYISHHLAKAFESLFGSVTCLPGCFCMYRLRTADKGRPLIISDKVILEYSDGNIDTLHKKNLLSLGEDRYLTTLMTKHFPQMSYKFIPDAYAATAAPETWSVLLSQRRRWINSTIHNLAELVFLEDLCGFCCFSMRFVVFIDLFGTLILPATCGYLAYLIYRLATHTGAFPVISLAILGGVYGLQALIFILKRQWQHVGWMIIYILAYPIYSFVLPIYSFWNQDNFSWGNTRIVIGEKGSKQIVAVDDEGFDPRSVPLQRWDDYAAMNSLPGRRGNNEGLEKAYQDDYVDKGYEMDDMQSMYSGVKPASTILTGFPNQAPTYIAPTSPAPYSVPNRHSTLTNLHLNRFVDQPNYQHVRQDSVGGMSETPYRDNPMSQSRASLPFTRQSTDHLMSISNNRNTRSPLGLAASRPVSTMDFRGTHQGPDELSITEAIRACLAEVDLDSVTKKQVRALVEQRLQTELVGDKKAFLDRQIDAELANMYTTSFAFFEALWELGITYVFVNLGSDHPSIIEAIVKGQKEKKDQFPKIITCPNEMVALSLADGFARLSSRPQCVLVHVDVGTQGLGAAVHNASCGRAPVLIFAGLSPFTLNGEMRGSRTEYIHWIQDVPDQKQIVGQYCRYTGELKTGKNVKEMVGRALQFAGRGLGGPVYLCGAREVMEEDIESYKLKKEHWEVVGPGALDEATVKEISEALVSAKEPLVIVGYTGRNHAAVGALVKLAETVKGLRVLDTGGSDMCFPASHRASLGLRYGVDPCIRSADVILVVDCDVPWIPTQCRPKEDAKIYHVDADPLKQQMPVFYIPALGRWKADAFTTFAQLSTYISSSSSLSSTISSSIYDERWQALVEAHTKRREGIRSLAALPEGQDTPESSFNINYLCASLREAVPQDTIFAVEAVTNTAFVADQIAPDLPGSWINCGGGGLGWSGGGAMGIKLAAEEMFATASSGSANETANDLQGKSSNKAPGRFVCQIVGDGTFLFSVPASVYWISHRYKIPILTIVLNNRGWNAPRKSLLLVHPDGEGSKVDNDALNIAFTPTPDYAGIAKAATGGEIYAAQVGKVGELENVLREAVKAVRDEGRSAVIDAHLDGSEGKYLDAKRELQAL